MERLKWVLLAVLLATAGCTRTARLYPVEPLNTSAPVIVGKIHGAVRSGDVSFTLADGEVCKGQWNLVPLPSSTSKAAPSLLAPIWDQVYGSGYYVAHVLGTRWYAQAVAKGSRGTTLSLEFHQSATATTPNTDAIAAVRGVAMDSNNRIYKLTLD
jgi:hypothetical protein